MKLSELFSKVNNEERDQNQDYKVTYTRASVIVMFVASILFALAVWTVAVVADSSIHTFDSVKIQVLGSDAAYDYTLSNNTVSFICRGRTKVVTTFNDSSVVPYIDVSGYEPGTYEFEIKYYYDKKNTLLLSEYSIETIQVTIVPEMTVELP